MTAPSDVFCLCPAVVRTRSVKVLGQDAFQEWDMFNKKLLPIRVFLNFCSIRLKNMLPPLFLRGALGSGLLGLISIPSATATRCPQERSLIQLGSLKEEARPDDPSSPPSLLGACAPHLVGPCGSA